MNDRVPDRILHSLRMIWATSKVEMVAWQMDALDQWEEVLDWLDTADAEAVKRDGPR